MKKIILVNSLFILSLLMTNAEAHKAAVDEHAQLTPIPAYSPPISGASGKASLNALSKLTPNLVERFGITIDAMSDPQRNAFFKFLSASLGKEGYEKVAHIIAAEAALNGDRDPATSRWNPANYFFSVYGEPSMQGDWGWQIDGHHLVMNIAVNNGVINSMSPSFIGTEPAVFIINGVKYEEFVDMHQVGKTMYDTLTADQKKLATLNKVPNDVLTGAKKDGFIPELTGIKGSELSPEQKQTLLKAIETWVLLQAEENASKRMKELESQLNDISFSWAGGNQAGSSLYFKIQGPTLIIELSLKSLDSSEPAGSEHYHTMYRNPTLEYGLKN